MPKTDFRIWIVTGLAIVVPSATIIYTYGQEQQKVEQLSINYEKTKAEQLQINKELINTLTEVRITMKEISTKLQMMEDKR